MNFQVFITFFLLGCLFFLHFSIHHFFCRQSLRIALQQKTIKAILLRITFIINLILLTLPHGLIAWNKYVTIITQALTLSKYKNVLKIMQDINIILSPYIFQILLSRSMERKQPHDQNDLNPDDESSNLDYLVSNVPNHQQPQKQSLNDTKRKPRDSNQKQSQIKKVLINNRGKDKKAENDSIYQGIYLYKPGVELPSLYKYTNQTVKIIIASEYIKRHNPELLKRSIFGADPYTSNSDAVCILIHSGSININTFPSKRYQGVELSCKVIKPKKNYVGSFKNGILSRNLKGYNGNALKPESVRNLVSLGPMQLLERYAANMHIPIGKNRIKPRPRNISKIIPIPETHIVFNMNNQPAYKYSLFNIADKGFEKNQFMIKKLDNFVLYLQTEKEEKYELLKKIQMDVFDIFRFSKIKNPELKDNTYFQENGSPLEENDIEVIFSSLEWDQIVWGNSSLQLRGQLKIQGIRSFKYYKKQKYNKNQTTSKAVRGLKMVEEVK